MRFPRSSLVSAVRLSCVSPSRGPFSASVCTTSSSVLFVSIWEVYSDSLFSTVFIQPVNLFPVFGLHLAVFPGGFRFMPN